MLVLSRKKNEVIVIDEDVKIIVVEIRGDRVRLGIEAPVHKSVHREEVYLALKRNQKLANQPPNPAGDAAPPSP